MIRDKLLSLNTDMDSGDHYSFVYSAIVARREQQQKEVVCWKGL